MTVGLALIVRDEEDSLPNLLDSIQGAFDQVVLCDTGSKDRTIDVFLEWADTQDGTLGDFVVKHFTWCDDFSAARNYADTFLTTDWKVWADADDVIAGAENFRELAANAPPEVGSFIVGYDYAQTPEGACICYLKRERLVRNKPSTRWQGAVHEAQTFEGMAMGVEPEKLEYRHNKVSSTSDSNARNLRILRKWAEREPGNFRVLNYLGTEYAMQGKHRTALRWYRKGLKVGSGWDQEYAQAHRKMAMSHIALGEFDKAEALAFKQLAYLPSWPDASLTLAELAFNRQEWAKCAEWAQDLIRRGVPDTLLIINPMDYGWQPTRLLAASLFSMNEVDRAIELGTQAAAIQPDQELLSALAHWRSVAKREHTVNTYLMAAEQLMAHDEQLKALILLDQAVPHFAYHHPRIVQLRSFLRERISKITDEGFYEEEQQVLQEDDETAYTFASQLPRAHFLAAGIKEQMA